MDAILYGPVIRAPALPSVLANVYAEVGVSEYAIVLHAEKAVEVFSQPTASGYAVKQRLQGEQDQLLFTSLPGHAFAISKLFS